MSNDVVKQTEAQDITPVVEQARDQSIQARSKSGNVGGAASVLYLLTLAGQGLPAWWSPARDTALRSYWKGIDHLSGAVYSMESKMTAIPFTIIPKGQTDRTLSKLSDDFTYRLMYGAEFGAGWLSFYGKWIQDLITCDNGAFAEVIGAGRPDGPIIGAPVTVAHLDSGRCIRTGDPEFPVVYMDQDGKQYKLHYTRVIFTSQMTSPISEMFGVGFSAVSRCSNVAQTVLDVLVYKQEKLGSRPHRTILVTKGGLDPTDIQTAFEQAENTMDSQNLSRYSRTVVTGSSSIMEAGIQEVSLSSLPDGFSEETSITFGMAAIALAFGVDARELWPSMSAGATRADAILSHLKQRGKGPGQIIQDTETQFNHKFLPPTLKMSFDFQDDAEDRQVADIKLVRANARKVALGSGYVDNRTIRIQMLETKDLDQGEFERLELVDGRMVDGTTVLTLFYKSEYSPYLDLKDAYSEAEKSGLSRANDEANNTAVLVQDQQDNAVNDLSTTDNQTTTPVKPVTPAKPADNKKPVTKETFDPLRIDQNDPQTMFKAIQIVRAQDQKALANTSDTETVNRALYALDELEKQYKKAQGSDGYMQKPGGLPKLPPEHNSGFDPRVRGGAGVSPTENDITPPQRDNLRPGRDDNPNVNRAGN